MHYTHHSILTCRRFKIPYADADKFTPFHQAVDSSKKYYWAPQHRGLLHTIDYGQYLLLRRFGVMYNGIPTNELLVAHIEEDFSNFKPRLQDFKNTFIIPEEKIQNLKSLKISKKFKEFIFKPYELTGNINTLAISCSSFGVEWFGSGYIAYLDFLITNDLFFDITEYLTHTKITRELNNPDRNLIKFLKEFKINKDGKKQ